jgi:hypothetical protein
VVVGNQDRGGASQESGGQDLPGLQDRAAERAGEGDHLPDRAMPGVQEQHDDDLPGLAGEEALPEVADDGGRVGEGRRKLSAPVGRRLSRTSSRR